MNRNQHSFLLLASLLTLFMIIGCSDDDDPTDPGGGGGDTTAPLVVSIDPGAGETGVAVDEPIVITFNEDMDTATDDGQITVTPGGATGLTWTGARTLSVAHGTWDEGTAVTVDVGTGLADLAGNALAETVSATFYVESSDLVLLAASPADGAVDVNRSTTIALLFSATMDAATFGGAVELVDGGQNPLDFTASSSQGDWMLVDPDADLPADASITLTVSTDAQDMGGRNLATPVSVTFTTGQDTDTTAPTIVSFEPASGAEIDAGTTYIRATFSEPVDPLTANPVRVNAELFMLAVANDIEPTWSADGTVVTIALPTPLPAGLPLELAFADYQDRAGNVQNTTSTWTAVVQGTADYYPLIDGRQFVYDVVEAGGASGNAEPEWIDQDTNYIQFDAAGGAVFHRTWYDSDFTIGDDWEVMQQSGGFLQILGFRDTHEDGSDDINFDAPIDFVALPPAGTWTSSTTATLPGDGTMAITGEGRFVEQIDLPWLAGGEDHPEIFWKDVRLVLVEHTLSAGDDLVETGVDSLWLAPTVGVVQFGSSLEDLMDDTWEWEHGVLLPPQD